MELTQLMTDLDNAVDAVEEQKAALAKAQAAYTAATARAKATVDTANEEYQKALQTAQDLRRQLDAALNTSLPANDNRVRS